jgi:hypothetical protein
MCNENHNNPNGPISEPFAGFEDLHELPSDDDVVLDSDVHTQQDEENLRNFGAKENRNSQARFEEKCAACRGSGNFVSWSGRIVGKCFKCKGTGIRKFKTSPETREKQRERAQAKRDLKRKMQIEATENFKAENKELVEYLNEVSGWNKFAASLLDSIERFGRLSEKQLAAALKMKAKHDAKREADAEQAKDGIDLSEIPSGLYAVPNGETRLKIAIRRPGKNSKWHGWTFVDDGAAYGSRNNYGRQAPGKNYVGKCEDQLAAIAADPKAAAQEYGRLTGTCGMCGRHLEDELSVERGIGPICWSKF